MISFRKHKRKENFPTHFMKLVLFGYPNQTKEVNRPISSMNLDTKILNKIIEN